MMSPTEKKNVVLSYMQSKSGWIRYLQVLNEIKNRYPKFEKPIDLENELIRILKRLEGDKFIEIRQQNDDFIYSITDVGREFHGYKDEENQQSHLKINDLTTSTYISPAKKESNMNKIWWYFIIPLAVAIIAGIIVLVFQKKYLT